MHKMIHRQRIGEHYSRSPIDNATNEFAEAISKSGFQEIAITTHHAAKTYDLPSYHRDPFDRLLIAQAICEPMKLLTADKMLARYTELVITV